MRLTKRSVKKTVDKCFFWISGAMVTCKSISRKSKSGAEMKKRHGEWICRLVSTLILHCKSPFLKLCRITAFKNAELAELIFPAVLADIAENHPERKRRKISRRGAEP